MDYEVLFQEKVAAGLSPEQAREVTERQKLRDAEAVQEQAAELVRLAEVAEAAEKAAQAEAKRARAAARKAQAQSPE